MLLLLKFAIIFFILFSTILFIIFNYLNDAAYRKYKKFDQLYLIETNGIPQQKIKFWEKTRKDQTVVESKYTIVGYIIMLVFRLACQLICLYLDIELSTHISQKAGGIPEVFNIPERWICSTYNFEDSAYHEILPQQNLSSIFHRSDAITACQNLRDVNCWQPNAYLRTYGLKFMFAILLVEILMTMAELLVELVKPCVGVHTGFSRPNPAYKKYLFENEKINVNSVNK